MERETGFEPATPCLEGRHSTTELLPHLYEQFYCEGGMRCRITYSARRSPSVSL